jgi:polyamine oxidase
MFYDLYKLILLFDRNAVDNDTNFEAVEAQLDAAAEKVEENEKKTPSCEDRPLHSSLADAGWLADTPLKSAVEWNYYDYEFAISTKEMSTREFVETNGTEIDSIVTDKRGFATIIQYLAKNFTDKVKTGHVVQSINYTSEGVEIQTRNGSIFKAKYALCTFSTNVLADQNFVKFLPALPSWKIKAINNLPLGYFTLVIVRFQHVFWDDHEYLLNAGHIRGKFPIIANRNQKNVQPGSNILMFVATGDDALRTEKQAQSKTVDEVMETLKEMYPAANISRPTGE